MGLEGRDQELATTACELAETLLRSAQELETRRERRRRTRLARLLSDPRGKRFTLALTDGVIRIHDPGRAVQLFRALVRREGVPRFAGAVDRLAIRIGAVTGALWPRAVVPLIVARLRREAHGVVLPAEDPAFGRYVRRRRADGMALNVNVLGEAVLGEQEALQRRDAVVDRLARPDVDYVSVKISAVCSRLNVLAFDSEVERIAERLRPLFEVAARSRPAKFINLDMEEYRDLPLTIAVFQRLLEEEQFRGLDAGIVLQAYLPDSYAALLDICEWARRRRGSGGGRVKVRLVKGANLAMESVEAELRGWEPAPYGSKAAVDANFKRLLEAALDDRFADAIRVGVASHNLFDVAWALVLRKERGAESRVDIEMLEGMANPQARAAAAKVGGVLLYAPVVRRHEFDSAIAYLVRRLDENTGEENFLRAAFSLSVGSPEWVRQRTLFLESVQQRHAVGYEPRRRQDRRAASTRQPDSPFRNEPDTDWVPAVNRAWIEDHLRRARTEAPSIIPAVVAGEEVSDADHVEPPRVVGDLFASPAHVRVDVATVDRAVAAAAPAGKEWNARALDDRRAVLMRVADVMAANRGQTLATMAWDAGKTVREGDPEVSEAVDFARYYATATRTIETLATERVAFEPFGTVVVASPWNFPYAIPAGGVLAALAAGNAVILKPAPETVHTAWLLAQHCWEAGVPRDVLQFVPCSDDHVGRRLITHPGVDAVILTGSSETARMFLSWKPALRLFAETSGKNALVVTAAADVDDAVRDLVQSAFGHAGQKCSAASLAIVEASVYDDPRFRRKLEDAVNSLRVGPAWDLRTDVGPLIRPPAGPLAIALSELDAGEEWLVEPRQLDADGYLWTPGVKFGVAPGSAFHRAECFGPVLGVMRAGNLDEAIEMQNATSFGLTGGIHSLDEAEIANWQEAVEVGNAYVNRSITGAIVRRQPFGGWKGSVVGPGAKAGGPNYVLSLGRLQATTPSSAATIGHSFSTWWSAEFARGHDPTGLRCERNEFRYRPLPRGVLLRVGFGVPIADVDTAVMAAETAGTRLVVSSAAPLALSTGRPVVVESDELFSARVAEHDVDRVRLVGVTDDAVRVAIHEAGLQLDETPIVPHGRVELLRWVREQAVSETRHRHGNVVDRES